MIFILAILVTVICIVSNESLDNPNIDPTVEKTLIEKIRKFLLEEEHILVKLIEFKNSIEEIHWKAAEDENNLDNLTYDFLIVKRIVLDWHFIAALASFNKHEFLNELQKDVSIIQQHPSFPSLSNLTDLVLKIADYQEKQGINSVGEFAMTLTSDPYTKLTASECSVFAEVLKGVNKDTLAKSWEMECETIEALLEDPLMEIRAITDE